MAANPKVTLGEFVLGLLDRIETNAAASRDFIPASLDEAASAIGAIRARLEAEDEQLFATLTFFGLFDVSPDRWMLLSAEERKAAAKQLRWVLTEARDFIKSVQ